eukprot:TRINITY_DN67858_c7_g1_i1.p1 TRINITY_DN67858_c7_g1~~TRINITY_DN67858_c7_g1_i1.p1  ORF type:complete len:420 (-),score=48.45 TRINITY_DN67858_c7_g1_i1:958-2217(-)
MQRSTDSKVVYYQPDGSGRDYYICVEQGQGRVQTNKPLPLSHQSLGSAVKDRDIITGQPKKKPGTSKEVEQLVHKPPKHIPSRTPIVDEVRKKVMARGGRTGFRGLTRMLRIMDDNGNKNLDRTEFQNGLNVYGIYPTKQQMDELMAWFDRDGSGQISVTEFLRGVREPMNQRRRDFVLQAYALLDVITDGLVTFKDIKQAYDTSKHPDLLAGKKTEQEIILDFMKGWDKDHDGTVTKDEFLDYYEDISTGIDDDDYFELMMRNAWHISGGEGVCANTTCRRVLVMHKDGTQTVEEIKNDLGVAQDDVEEMQRRLVAQGITDIRKVVLVGSIDNSKERLRKEQQARPKSYIPPAEPRVTRTDYTKDAGIPKMPLGATRPPNMYKTTNQAMYQDKVKDTNPAFQVPVHGTFTGRKLNQTL